MRKKKRSLKKKNKIRKKGAAFYVGLICLVLGIILALATGVATAFNYIAPGGAAGYTPGEGTKGVTLSEYIIGIYSYAATIIGLLSVVVIIIAGYRYMAAMGNPQYLSEAKAMAMGAIAGLVLVILSYLILSTLNPGTVSW